MKYTAVLCSEYFWSGIILFVTLYVLPAHIHNYDMPLVGQVLGIASLPLIIVDMYNKDSPFHRNILQYIPAIWIGVLILLLIVQGVLVLREVGAL